MLVTVALNLKRLLVFVDEHSLRSTGGEAARRGLFEIGFLVGKSGRGLQTRRHQPYSGAWPEHAPEPPSMPV